jgi:hypothetical protein
MAKIEIESKLYDQLKTLADAAGESSMNILHDYSRLR